VVATLNNGRTTSQTDFITEITDIVKSGTPDQRALLHAENLRSSALSAVSPGWVGGNPKFEIRNSKFEIGGRIEHPASSIGWVVGRQRTFLLPRA
jgi:hypothetical protein